MMRKLPSVFFNIILYLSKYCLLQILTMKVCNQNNLKIINARSLKLGYMKEEGDLSTW